MRSGQGDCNSYSHDDQSLQCQLASLTFLEDPLADGGDGGEMSVMVEVVAADSLSRVCRGGEHCCRPDQPCGEGAGDCNTDQDCQASVLHSHWSRNVEAPLCHKEPAKGKKYPPMGVFRGFSRGLWMPELVLYGIRELVEPHYEPLDQ